MEYEDEQRVQDDIAHRADQNGQHAGFCKALRGNEGVHAERQLDEDRADGIDVHVADGVVNGIFACAEGKQQRAVPDQKHSRQNERDENLQRKAAAERLFCRLVVVLDHEDRRTRCAAGADERGKRRDDHDNRQAHADAGQRKRAVPGHVPDVDAVDDVVEHVDQLRNDRRHGELEKQFPDRLGA